MKKLMASGVMVLLLAAAGYGIWRFAFGRAGRPGIRTAAVERGELVASISATGTLEPEEVVDVGAQVAGQIKSLGPDLRSPTKTIDYGSPVEESTVLALIDESLYQAQVEQARAQVEQAQAQVQQGDAQVEEADANIQRAEADLGQMQAKQNQTQRDWDRARQTRSVAGAISETDYDSAQAAYLTAKANLAVGQAAIGQARASRKDAEAARAKARGMLSDAKANLSKAEINRGYCTIKSPVKGVIVDRRVNIGQTVVSSLNAPSLFLIAKDLRRMQIWASVNEADIGQIRAGQPVRFSVDAYPGESFTGTVAQIRLNATMTQNVVTYTVVISTDNSDGRLLPYLTANVQFEVAQRKGVLTVPNAALRWQPPPQLAGSEGPRSAANGPGPSRNGHKDAGRGPAGTVWVASAGQVRPVAVQTGLTDGALTEIVGGELQEGDSVVVGLARSDSAAGEGGSPFTPQMFGSKKPSP